MEPTDRLLKDFLKARRPVSLCPSEEELIEYIDGIKENDIVEKHISNCPDCLQTIILVKEADKNSYENIDGPSKTIKDRIKALAVNKSHTLHKNWFKKNMWLILSLASLLLSLCLSKTFPAILGSFPEPRRKMGL